MLRPRFQFGLRTLFLLTLIAAAPMSYIGWQAKIVAHRKAVLKTAVDRGLLLTPDDPDATANPTVPWIRRMMGDAPVRWVWWGGSSKEDREQFREAFPETKVETRW